MFARFLPRLRPRLIDRTFRISRPLGSTATQQAAASRLLRAGPPASAASVLSASGVCRWQAPSRDLGGLRPRSPHRRSPSHVPCKSRRPGSRRLHAGHRLASHRDTRQAHHERTARPLAFDATSITLTTPQQRTPTPGNPGPGASGTSSWSPPDAIKRAFSLSLTTTVFSQRSTGRFGALPRRTTPEGQQASISSTAPPMKDASYMTSSSAFVTHGCCTKGSEKLCNLTGGRRIAIHRSDEVRVPLMRHLRPR